MKPSSVRPAGNESRRKSPGRPSARIPLATRKRLDRQAARQRIVAHVQRRPTAEQQGFDPLLRGPSSRRRRRLAFVAAVVGSLIVHAGVVGFGIALRLARGPVATRDEVKIEIKPPAPPPPPEKKPEPPPPPVDEPKKVPPKIVKAPPPPPQAVEPPKAVRVVGLSLESTTEGGDGPSFAVGNTRLGDTAERAVAPKDVAPVATAPVAPAGPPGPGKSNRVASRIPVAGVKYELPKRKKPVEPPFPPTLRSQGIESDVVVLVSIDANGKVTNVKILQGSPYPEFNEAARTTAEAEEYEPATRDGVPMPYTLSFRYKFRLDEE